MRNFLFLFLTFFLYSCATKYILPAQRFLSPETQGGDFHSSIEIHQTTAHEAKLAGNDYHGIAGVKYDEAKSTAYQFSTGLFNQFDFIWSHVGHGNSLVGGKFQAMGGDRSGAGTKLSVAYLVGGNSHETDDKSLKFKLNAQELWGVLGHRMSPHLMPYASLGYAKYNFKGHIKSGYYKGERPNIRSDIYFLVGGVEFNYEGFIFRLETGMQILESSKTKDKWAYRTGFGLGYAW